jgi:uncharacterized membrane protein YozB (DUF420 family)
METDIRVATPANAAERAVRPLPADSTHRRFVAYAILLLSLTIVGFAPTFFFRPFLDREPLALATVVHGVILTGWFAIFLAQGLLIGRRNIRWHRNLGIIGAVVAAVAAIAFVWLAIDLFYRRPPDVEAALIERARLARIARELTVFAAFPALVAFGFVWRRNREAHKRLMLLATLALIGPALSRLVTWPGEYWPALAGIPRVPATLAVLAVVYGAIVLHDAQATRRLHPALGWGTPLLYVWTFGGALILPALII